MSEHTLLEQPYYIFVVRVLVKLQNSTVLHELFEFRWMAFAQFLESGLYFLFLDIVILFILAPTWQTLPRECPSQKVKEDMPDSF